MTEEKTPLIIISGSHDDVSRMRWIAVLAEQLVQTKVDVVLGGITSAMFGAGGPPYAIYLSQRDLSKEAFRATLAVTSIASISMRLAAFALTGLMSHLAVWAAAAVALLEPTVLTNFHVVRDMLTPLWSEDSPDPNEATAVINRIETGCKRLAEWKQTGFSDLMQISF